MGCGCGGVWSSAGPCGAVACCPVSPGAAGYPWPRGPATPGPGVTAPWPTEPRLTAAWFTTAWPTRPWPAAPWPWPTPPGFMPPGFTSAGPVPAGFTAVGFTPAGFMTPWSTMPWPTATALWFSTAWPTVLTVAWAPGSWPDVSRSAAAGGSAKTRPLLASSAAARSWPRPARVAPAAPRARGVAVTGLHRGEFCARGGAGGLGRARSQGGQRVLLTGPPRATPGPGSGNRYALRRHGLTQRRRTGRVFGRRHHGAHGTHGVHGTHGILGVLGGTWPPAPPPGTARSATARLRRLRLRHLRAGTADRAVRRTGRRTDLRPSLRETAPESGRVPRSRVRRLCRAPSPASARTGRRRALRTAGGVRGAGNAASQEGVHRGTPGPPPPAARSTGAGAAGRLLGHRDRPTGDGDRPQNGTLRRAHRPHGTGRPHRTRRAGSLPRPRPHRNLENVRTAAHTRHLVRLQHASVGPHDAPHDRLVHRVPACVGPPHLDADDLAALCRGHHDGRVDVTARRDDPGVRARVARRVDPRHVGDEMGHRGGEPPRVDHDLYRRRVHRELRPPGPDQLDRALHAGGDDRVEHDRRTGELFVARVEPLEAEDVVDEGGHPGVPGGEVMQDLIGLGPQLARVVGGERGQFAAQFVEGPAQGRAEDGEELLVSRGQALVPRRLALGQLFEAVLLALGERCVPLLFGGEFLRALLLGGPDLLGAPLLGGLDRLRVPLLGRADLLGVAGEGGLVLLGQLVVGPAVGERHHRADQLVAVAHRGRRQVDRHLGTALGPQDLPAHPVLATGAEGVRERGLLVGEGFAVGARVQHQGVQLLSAEVARPESQYLRGGRVDEDDPSVGVRADDALGRGPQDHLGLPLRTRQLGLGVHGAREVAHDEHQQLVAGVAVVVVRVPAVFQRGAGDLDGELGAVRAPRRHARGLRPAAFVDGVRAPHRAGDEPGVELRQQIEQTAPHERGARRLERLQRDRVGVHDGAVGVDEHQRVRESVEYGCEASSASGWPAAHDDASSLVTAACRPAQVILPLDPWRVTGGSLRGVVARATPDEREVARRRCEFSVLPGHRRVEVTGRRTAASPFMALHRGTTSPAHHEVWGSTGAMRSQREISQPLPRLYVASTGRPCQVPVMRAVAGPPYCIVHILSDGTGANGSVP